MTDTSNQLKPARLRVPSGKSSADLLRELEDDQKALRSKLSGLDPSAVNSRPPSGKWSVIENVRHLLFAEQAHLTGLARHKVVWSAYGFNPETMRRQRKLPPVEESQSFQLEDVLAAWGKIHTDLRDSLQVDTPELRIALKRHLGHLRRHVQEIDRLLKFANSKPT